MSIVHKKFTFPQILRDSIMTAWDQKKLTQSIKSVRCFNCYKLSTLQHKDRFINYFYTHVSKMLRVYLSRRNYSIIKTKH